MYICVCKAVTDRQIRHAVVERGTTSLGCLARETGACTQCGKCARAAREILQECLEEHTVRCEILSDRPAEAIAA